MRENIIAGLVSGLFVTIFAFAFRAFWHAVIIPWFEERVYKDVKIEGKWFTLHTEELNERQEVVQLKRHGHSVSGLMTCIEGPDQGEEYILNGSFRNMVLSLHYETSDVKSTDRGAITLRCKRNGEQLVGKIANYDTLTEEISSANIYFFRYKSAQEEMLSMVRKRRQLRKDLVKQRREVEESLKRVETESDASSEQQVNAEKEGEVAVFKLPDKDSEESGCND